MRLWWSVISVADRPRIAVVVSNDHAVMDILVGDLSGMPGRVDRWSRSVIVYLRGRSDGPWRWGPADLRALYAKVMLDVDHRGGRLVEMTEPEVTTCTLQMTRAILTRQLASQLPNTDEELLAA